MEILRRRAVRLAGTARRATKLVRTTAAAGHQILLVLISLAGEAPMLAGRDLGLFVLPLMEGMKLGWGAVRLALRLRYPRKRYALMALAPGR